jgi:adenylate cyclase
LRKEHLVEKDVAIMMADLTGYTAMTEAHGGVSAAQIVSKYMNLVDRALSGTAKVVQRIGDQVVIIADHADDLLPTALQLNKITSDEHHFLSIHGGLHYGSVFMQGINLFGSTINIAARIMNIAQRGEILASQSFIARLSGNIPAKSIGMHRLKNVSGEFELFLLSDPASKPLHVDPVCHMQIDAFKSNLSLTFRNVAYHFCSTQCRDRFEATPENFVTPL